MSLESIHATCVETTLTTNEAQYVVSGTTADSDIAPSLRSDTPTEAATEPALDGVGVAAFPNTIQETDGRREQAAVPDPAGLALELERIVHAVVEVQELSQRAREAAQTNLARYDELRNFQALHEQHLERARSLSAQAQAARQQAFGTAAQLAGDALVAQADAIEGAFVLVVERALRDADEFLCSNPEIETLVEERRRAEVEAKRQEAAAARARQLETLLAHADEALEQGIVAEARRHLATIEHNLPEAVAEIAGLRFRIDQRLRAEQDADARRALSLAVDQQAQGDLEAALATLEQVNVRVLSREVSEDVFGRWSDTCSRLAQTAGASLKRFAPAQGRGLILYEDPAWPDRLFVFSSLGMGTGFPYGTVIERDPNDLKRDSLAATILSRARGFREATATSAVSWFGQAAPVDAWSSAAPTRH